MRAGNSSPAVQLGSVAHRYAFERRHPAWLRPAAGGPGLPVRSGPQGGRDTGERDERLIRLEAVLFLAREPLASRKLAQYANLADGTEARTLIRQLNEHYDGVGRAFRVEEVAGGFQLLTRPQFAPWLRRLAHVPRETRLSAPALETLAVVAYRQPVPKSTVDAIRGVNCGEILRQLLERDLIRIDGRGDELGRPYLYSTTRQFLQLFGLASLDDLPRRAAAASPAEPAAHASQPTTPAASTLEEESNVKVIFPPDLHPDDLLPDSLPYGPGEYAAPRAIDDDDEDDFDDDEDEDLDDDEEDDFDDEEEDLDEDFDDDFDDDEEDDEEEEEEDDSDLEDADWEEVDDEEDEEEDEDDEDDDWDEDEEEEEDDDDD